MTPKANHKQIDAEGQATIQELLQEKLRLAIKLTMIQTLEEEVEAFVKAEPYQRSAEREIIAMVATHETWGLRWVSSKSYPCHVHARVFGAGFLNAIKGDRRNWTKASVRCSYRA